MYEQEVDERSGLMETQPIATLAEPSSMMRDIDTLQLGDMIFNELQQSMDIDHLSTCYCHSLMVCAEIVSFLAPEARAVLGDRTAERDQQLDPAPGGPPSDSRTDMDGVSILLNSDSRSSQQPRVHGNNDHASGLDDGAASLEPISEETEDVMKCTCEDPVSIRQEFFRLLSSSCQLSLDRTG